MNMLATRSKTDPVTNIKLTSNFTANNWYSKGERIEYDAKRKRIHPENERPSSPNTLKVFRRYSSTSKWGADNQLTTFLPGFPEGSFGWSRIDSHLPDEGWLPRLFVEYVGQGDSDKPGNYKHSIMERADLVEAQWRDLAIKSTFVVAFDFSAIVVLELLSRQQDRTSQGLPPVTNITGVVLINGGLFADGHTHPWFTTPLLKTPFGRMGVWLAQRSRFIFGEMVAALWSKQYDVSKTEIDEMFDAVTRRDGAKFMSRGAKFVDEHKKNAARWNLQRLYQDMHRSVSFHIVGSDSDPFEWDQIIKAQERLGDTALDIRVLTGGHLSTSEHPKKLCDIIVELTS